jgi:hypothetical protein
MSGFRRQVSGLVKLDLAVVGLAEHAVVHDEVVCGWTLKEEPKR